MRLYEWLLRMELPALSWDCIIDVSPSVATTYLGGARDLLTAAPLAPFSVRAAARPRSPQSETDGIIGCGGLLVRVVNANPHRHFLLPPHPTRVCPDLLHPFPPFPPVPSVFLFGIWLPRGPPTPTFHVMTRRVIDCLRATSGIKHELSDMAGALEVAGALQGLTGFPTSS